MKNPAALALAALLAATPAMAIEEPAFETVKKSGDFELRQYAPMIVAEAFVQGGPWGAGNDGFRRVIASHGIQCNIHHRFGGRNHLHGWWKPLSSFHSTIVRIA